jgi:hypothetical protein
VCLFFFINVLTRINLTDQPVTHLNRQHRNLKWSVMGQDFTLSIVYGGRRNESWCEFFSQTCTPFIEIFAQISLFEHYLLQPRGQSRCAMWQKRLTAWGTEIFNCRHFRSLEGELLHSSLHKLRCAYFWPLTAHISLFQILNFITFLY